MLATIVGVVMLQRSRPVQSSPAQFSHLGAATTPFVPKGDFVTSSWFCRGGADRRPAARRRSRWSPTRRRSPLSGKITAFTDAAGVAPVDQRLRGARTRHRAPFDLGQMQTQGTFVSAMVEIYGGGGFVEQRADEPRRAARCPRARTRRRPRGTSPTATPWRAARNIVITNPFPSDAIVNIREATSTESRTPQILQTLLVKPKSVLVISQDLLAKRRTGARHHASRAPAAGSWSVAPRSTTSVRPSRVHDDPRRAVAGRPGLLRRRRDGRRGSSSATACTTAQRHRRRGQRRVPRRSIRASGFVNAEPLTVPAGKVVSLIAAESPVFPQVGTAWCSRPRRKARSSSNGPSPARPATRVATTVVIGQPPRVRLALDGAWRSAPIWPSTTCSSC